MHNAVVDEDVFVDDSGAVNKNGLVYLGDRDALAVGGLEGAVFELRAVHDVPGDYVVLHQLFKLLVGHVLDQVAHGTESVVARGEDGQVLLGLDFL